MSVLDEFAKALPVVIGGLLAIGGGLAAQFITHHLSARRERNQLIRNKAEEFVRSLYEHKDWVSYEVNRLVFGNDLPQTPSPLDRAWAIEELYFPELTNVMVDITAAFIPVQAFLFEQGKARLADKARWLATYDSKAFTPLYDTYLKAINAAIHEAVRCATKRLET